MISLLREAWACALNRPPPPSPVGKTSGQMLSPGEDFFRRIVDITPNNIYIFDLTTMARVYTNKTSAATFGHSPEAVRPMGQDFVATVIHPDDVARVLRHIEDFKSARDGEIVEMTHRVKNAMGEDRWISKREAVFKRDGAGVPVQLVGVAEDITDKKMRQTDLDAANAALKASESILSSFVNTSPVLMSVMETTDTDINYVFANQATADFFRLQPADLQGRGALSLGILPDTVARLLTRYRESADTGRPVTVEVTSNRGDVTTWFSSTINYIGPGGGGRPRFSLLTVNVSSQKSAEQKLHVLNRDLESRIEGRTAELNQTLDRLRDSAARAYQAGQHLRTVLGHLPIILWACDEHGNLTLSEGQALVPMGMKPGQFVGESVFKINADHPEICGHVRTALGGKAVNFLSARGGRNFEGHVSPLQDMHGQPSGIVGFSIDITEKQRVAAERDALQVRERAIVESSRLKSEFLANMSHEIRTPLTGVLGTVRLLRETSPTPAQQELVATMQRCGEALLGVVNDILDVSKIEAGKMTLEHCGFDLLGCLDHAISTVAARALEKGLILRFDPGPGLPRALVGDMTRLSQIVINLLSNAVKFTAAGEVVVRADARAAADGRCALTVAVSDTGIGIPKASQARLFEAFNQADESTTRKYGGSGLGLAICKSLCELMGGRIWVDSEPGRGSTFTFEVTLVEATGFEDLAAAPADRAFDREFGLRHPLAILVAEDNPVNGNLARQFLERMGYHPTMVDNGRAAVEAQELRPFDLIFMDVHMPELDGLEATRRIRAGRTQGVRPRIVAMTASALSSSQDEARSAGMDDFVAKPMTVQSLVGCIERCLGSRPAAGTVDGFGAPHATELALILARFGDDEELCASIAALFISDFPKQKRRLEDAVARRHAKDIHFAAHTLRGASGTFSTALVAAAAEELERLSQLGDIRRAPELAALMLAEGQMLVDLLSHFIGRQSA